MNLKKILAGIDFGQDTPKVLAYASFFARQFNASLDLLYVIDYLVTPPSYVAPYIEEERKEALLRFAEIRARLSEKDIQAKTEVMAGRLQESFEAVSERLQADLLVLGFVTHALRRSSAEKLIKGLRMPMLVVRGRKAEHVLTSPLNIRRILCPFDFSEVSERALRIAKDLKGLFSSELYIVHIIPEDVLNKKIEMNDGRYQSLLDAMHEDSVKALRTLINEDELGVTVLTEKGVPAREIVSLSDEKDIDLVVMGARGLGLIKGMLIGSVTDSVLKSSFCPVLVVH